MSAKPFTFICGDDDYLVSERGKAWFGKETEGLSEDLSKEVVDGRAGTVAEVEDAIRQFRSAVQTLSLFGERKVVWFRDVSFMADSPTGRAQGTLDLLEGLKEVLEAVSSESVAVLITAQPVDKRRSFFKWCQKVSDFTALAGSKDAAQTCVGLIEGALQASGKTMTGDAMQLLIEKLSANTRLVMEETQKLITFVGLDGAAIDEQLVIDLVPNFGGADFFEAVEAFYTLDLSNTLEALKRHFFTEDQARPLLASLQSRNRLMLQLRVLSDAGLVSLGGSISKRELNTAAEAYGAHFGDVTEKSNLNVFTQNPWYLGRLAGTARRVPLKRLIDFQVAFAEAFDAILARPNEHEEVCRELAIRCLSRAS